MSTALIAEHDPLLLALLHAILEQRGYTTVCVTEGGDVLALVQLHHPQLVILNDRLPQLTGSDLCLSIKNDPALSGTIVVLVGAGDRIRDASYVQSIGADAALRIPGSPRDVAQIVTQLAPISAPLPA